MSEICNDARFEMIARIKKVLILNTNIETRKEEMDVIDSILFRLWQMGWLEIIDKNLSKQSDLTKYVLVEWPDSQDYLEHPDCINPVNLTENEMLVPEDLYKMKNTNTQ